MKIPINENPLYPGFPDPGTIRDISRYFEMPAETFIVGVQSRLLEANTKTKDPLEWKITHDAAHGFIFSEHSGDHPYVEDPCAEEPYWFLTMLNKRNELGARPGDDPAAIYNRWRQSIENNKSPSMNY